MDNQDSTTKNRQECFGFWTVLSTKNVGTKAHHRVKARCVCGKEKDVLIGHLRTGKSLSCGCHRTLTHGMTHSKTYSSWSGMKNRCLNKNNNRYHQYGGRGISICERWIDSFENFLEDMGECPDSHSIGRIDNDGSYCKDNCRWETAKQQSRNKTNTVRVLGESATDIAERIGMARSTLTTRIKRGWNEDVAVNTPVEDKSLCLSVRARNLGLNSKSVDHRVRRGWSEERALNTPIKNKRQLKELSENCGISSDVLSNRLLRGWSLERATTQPLRKRSK
jgi:lambda repressor-like predicted transcriptional regulator